VLRYVLGSQREEDLSWTAPLALRKSVTQMAAIRNRGKIANELLLAVSGDEEFEAYTTVIRFRDEAGMPVVMDKVKITSSDWIRATINGANYSIGPESAAEVTPDGQGGITVIQRADNIQTPVLFLEAGFLPAKLTVNPARKIFKGLADVRKGADLKAARDRNGDPLLLTSRKRRGMVGGSIGNSQVVQQFQGPSASWPRSRSRSLAAVTASLESGCCSM